MWQQKTCKPDFTTEANILSLPFWALLMEAFLSWGLSVLQEAMGGRVPVLLLGNKLDNEKEREVPRGLGEQLAKVKQQPFFSPDRVGTPR